MYTFENISTEEWREKTKGMGISGDWVYEINSGGDKVFALFYGKVRTLFGEPNYETDNWENMYCYYIEASSDGTSPLYLEIYHGSGGSSIAIPYQGEDVDPEAYEAARSELIALIESQTPSDYEWESTYEDVGVKIKYIVKDGKAEVIHDMTDMF